MVCQWRVEAIEAKGNRCARCLMALDSLVFGPISGVGLEALKVIK